MKRLYALLMFFLPPLLGYSQNSCPGTPTVLYEGKEYNTVQIGSQCWFKENLDVGTMIASNSEADSMRNNNIVEKYCYNNDLANCTIYGGLYQWNEAMQYVTTEKAQGICPSGWHIPTKSEFEKLQATVLDGNALKAIGQGTGPGAGTNTSGFCSLLAGYRHLNGYFPNLEQTTNFRSSTEYGTMDAYDMVLWNNGKDIFFYFNKKDHGFSIRCLMDEVTNLKDHSDNSSLPISIELFQNYPNPFNPETRIQYSVVSSQNVSLKVYDVLGNEVAILVNEEKQPGTYEVSFTTQQTTNNRRHTSGVYFYQLRAGNFVQTKKFILLK